MPTSKSNDRLKKGVSIVICTYNGQDRVEKVLEHLSVQQQCHDIDWEVLLVDNNSEDQTAKVAKTCWDNMETEAELRIVKEPKSGTMHARRTGILEARYDVFIFCDDDNWLAPDYLFTVHELLRQNPEIVGVGGDARAVFEADQKPPDWFEMYKIFYACGSQGEQEGIIQNKGGLFTAGLAMRTQVIKDIFDIGFENQLTGRRPGSLVAGEDMELTFFLQIIGHQFWYTPLLSFEHLMVSNRLTREYLSRLLRGIGVSKALLMPYELIFKNEHRSVSGNRWIQVTKHCIKHMALMIFNPFGRERRYELVRNFETIRVLAGMKSDYKKEISRILELKKTYKRSF